MLEVRDVYSEVEYAYGVDRTAQPGQSGEIAVAGLERDRLFDGALLRHMTAPEESSHEIHRGRSVDPIRNRSIDCAQRRPSRIAQTTSDWPRRMSPAENTFGREV